MTSTPNWSMSWFGSTTLRRDFDIFCPFTVHQPWAKMFCGGSMPIDFSIVGQYTACVVRMSLPIRW